MMKERELGEAIEQKRFFDTAPAPSLPEQDEGKRDMGPLYPFLISGGKNTERWYFAHINDITEYKFNIIPQYFGDESSYTEVFPNRIKSVLEKNADARIFCVFDWDTIFDHETNLRKYKAFEEDLQSEIESGTVILCPSMPSIEYWFLLHFENHTDLIKTCGKKLLSLLSPHMMPYFIGSDKKLLNLLKDKSYIENGEWVKELCADGKLQLAIQRAETNINKAIENGDLDNQSYTYVYKLFK
jgi:hypothetical protein